ncbi:stress response protein NST1 [Oryzias melastigma]|uniref:stress response protein NST1 n=1 Tax=Oryzias melastigma TaxID=30732 RepID=UPI000CF7F9FD|nr:stress response protein NST1 [Oryzias melastigma]
MFRFKKTRRQQETSTQGAEMVPETTVKAPKKKKRVLRFFKRKRAPAASDVIDTTSQGVDSCSSEIQTIDNEKEALSMERLNSDSEKQSMMGNTNLQLDTSSEDEFYPCLSKTPSPENKTQASAWGSEEWREKENKDLQLDASSEDENQPCCSKSLRPDYKSQASAWDSEDSDSEKGWVRENKNLWLDTSSDDEYEPWCSKSLRPDNKTQASAWDSEDSDSEKRRVKGKGKLPINPRYRHVKRRRSPTDEQDPKKEEAPAEENVKHKKGFFRALRRKFKKKKDHKVQSSESIVKNKETMEEQSAGLDEYFAQHNQCSKQIQTTEKEILEDSLSRLKVELADTELRLRQEQMKLANVKDHFMFLQLGWKWQKEIFEFESAMIEKERKRFETERREISNSKKAIEIMTAALARKEASLQERIDMMAQSDAEPLETDV